MEFIGYIGGQFGFQLDPDTITNLLIGAGAVGIVLLFLVTGGRR